MTAFEPTVAATPDAEQALRTELAAQGVSPHRDEDSLIGGQCNSWLVIGLSDGDFPNMAEQPYMLAVLYDPADPDEVTIDRPVKAADEWSTVSGTGTSEAEGVLMPGRSFPGHDMAALAAYIADWRRNPDAIQDAAMAELRIWQAAALNADPADNT
ncbi:hypothetical protein ACIGD1_34555 [Streptomyces sp. NPDC085612]|uniref:hypothetical protein n=1 Tax=Streptomyces sp. NPDC085612 TaxID=3365732 RepID=UPI0037D98370